jgi:hypothetical protein
MAKNDTRKLTCAACQHENEIERVYCHNCGEKLDRTLLPKLDETQSADEKSKTGKKVKNMMNPTRFNWLRNLKTLVLIEIFAAVVAAGFLATQAPENVPPMKSDNLPDVEVGDMWSGMMNARPSVSVTFREFDVNYYLRKYVKGSAGQYGIKFERAFAHFDPGVVTLSTQHDLWGMPIYNSIALKPAHAGGKWSADIQRITIGRLLIPNDLAKMVKLDTVTLGALAQVFEKEIKQLDRLEKIEPGDGTISFATKSAQ